MATRGAFGHAIAFNLLTLALAYWPRGARLATQSRSTYPTPTPDSRLPIPDSRFPTPYSPRQNYLTKWITAIKNEN
ncbi:hypothetical protein [Moorena producens]|uniref:hypothetical protein n=1 Tax=Moorena producens TaxID=1155739 RepID=UPI003C714AAE